MSFLAKHVITLNDLTCDFLEEVGVNLAEVSDLAVGQKISVRKSQDIPLSFHGTITKIYENSALVSIDSFEDQYAEVVADLQNKTVVGFKHIRVTTK